MRLKLLPLLALCTCAALAVSSWFILVYAPIEQTMLLTQKIFYVHLPFAWWAMVSFFGVFAASGLYLWKRSPAVDRAAGAMAEIGVLFSGLALITGSIWGRGSWGQWWLWEPRLVTTLIMWFIYAGYLLLRSLAMSRERKALISSVIGVAAFLDVPLVFFATRLWPQEMQAHPRAIGLEPAMVTTLLVCLGAWLPPWLTLTLTRYGQLADQDRADGLIPHV